jgi:hypothetical protein
VLEIKDDNGKVHKDHLPNSYYVSSTKGHCSLHSIVQENFESKARKELIAEPTTTGLL